jgi:hypothetical protein
MAKQVKQVPEREPEWTAEDSLLIRSAESLGRVIGTLQRELDKATSRLNAANGRSVHVKKTVLVKRKGTKTPRRPAARKTSVKRAAAQKK